MSSSLLSIVPWFLAALLICGLHIASAVILLRERHAGPWLMLAGSAISLVGQAGVMVLQLFPLRRNGGIDFQRIQAASAFSALGALMFAIGLLLVALHLRGRANRVAELEMILQSRG